MHISRLRLLIFLIYAFIAGIVLGVFGVEAGTGIAVSAILGAPALFILREKHPVSKPASLLFFLFPLLSGSIPAFLLYTGSYICMWKHKDRRRDKGINYTFLLPAEGSIVQRIPSLNSLLGEWGCISWLEAKQSLASRNEMTPELKKFDYPALNSSPYSLKFGVNTYGVPGGHIAAGPFDAKSSELGARGEKALGDMLNEIAKNYPTQMMVFHGLRFSPGEDGADVDHAVLIGNKLIFLDAKSWKYGNYSWEPVAYANIMNHKPTILRDGMHFDGNEPHIGEACVKWQRYLHYEVGRTIPAYIVFCQPNQSAYTVDNKGSGLNLALLADVKSMIIDMVEHTNDVPDTNMAHKVLAQMQV